VSSGISLFARNHKFIDNIAMILSGLNISALKSPVACVFGSFPWDNVSAILKLTAQETALLRMAEINPMDYTLADSRDASMYARVLLKLCNEAYQQGNAGNGAVSQLLPDYSSSTTGSSNTVPGNGNGPPISGSLSHQSSLQHQHSVSYEDATRALEYDPIGVASHYALSKLFEILLTLASGQVKTVSVASVFYVGKDGILVDQWKALLRVLNHTNTSRDTYAPKLAALCLTTILITACPSQRQSQLVVPAHDRQQTATQDAKAKKMSPRVVSYASAAEPLEAIISWTIAQLKANVPTTAPFSSSASVSTNTSNVSYNSNTAAVAICTPALRVLMEAPETRNLLIHANAVKYMARQMRFGTKKGSMSTGITTASLATAAAASQILTPPSGTAASVVSDLSTKKKGGQHQTASVQQLYEISFALWILTYELDRNYKLRCDFAKDSAVVAVLVDLVALAPREKVVRVVLSSLYNLATCHGKHDMAPVGQKEVDGKHFLNEMIACGLMKYMTLLRDRQFMDPDVVQDIDNIDKLLNENYHEMSRWEVYKNEVESGHLRWGSTHTEAFFKENARMLEGPDADFRLLKVLIALVSSSRSDPEVVAVACYDIGEFVRHYPNGRAIAKRLGAKEVVMPLIENENIELQRHALQCVSKLMVQNWEHVM
jgi:V-type H+-transporting ATPase subunit H